MDSCKKHNLAVVVCSLILGLASGGLGRVIYVDADGLADFDTIQAAVDDANDGDTVIIMPGIYTGDGNRDIPTNSKAITVQSDDPNTTTLQRLKKS